jgi:cyclopropane fatty-acyl-phospholipid synthase-like methyltransferase
MNNQDAKKYVGGHYDLIGKKVFEFLKEEGLKPEHTLIDIGCGNFRCGRFIMEYLNTRNYDGIEKHIWLVEDGFKRLNESQLIKEPQVKINKNFDLDAFIDGIYDFALAKSVFTHLTKPKIIQCLTNLKKVLKKDGVFYASVFIGDSKKNPKEDDDCRKFMYSMSEIEDMAEGWNVECLGNRGCLRQIMLKFTLK